MLTRIKHLLGIEGARLSLFLEETSNLDDGLIHGVAVFTSLRPVKVQALHLKLEERYERGRSSRKLIDKYLLSEQIIELDLEVGATSEQRVKFVLDFKKLKAPIDRFAEKNIVSGWLAKAAKLVKNADSAYILTGEAVVEGTRLNPFDTLEIIRE